MGSAYLYFSLQASPHPPQVGGARKTKAFKKNPTQNTLRINVLLAVATASPSSAGLRKKHTTHIPLLKVALQAMSLLSPALWNDAYF